MNEQGVLISGEQLEAILTRVVDSNKDDIAAFQERVAKNHESNFIHINPEEFIAVLDIATIKMDGWDGCNGYYELFPDQFMEVMQSFKMDDEYIKKYTGNDPYMTKQSLSKRYRFMVTINELDGDTVYQYRIVRTKDYNPDYKEGGILGNVQSIAMRMRRADET